MPRLCVPQFCWVEIRMCFELGTSQRPSKIQGSRKLFSPVVTLYRLSSIDAPPILLPACRESILGPHCSLVLGGNAAQEKGEGDQTKIGLRRNQSAEEATAELKGEGGEPICYLEGLSERTDDDRKETISVISLFPPLLILPRCPPPPSSTAAIMPQASPSSAVVVVLSPAIAKERRHGSRGKSGGSTRWRYPRCFLALFTAHRRDCIVCTN